MSPSEALKLAIAGIAGGFLGLVFFGGLWWTIRKGISSRHVALWFFTSQLIRTSVTLAGFYFVSEGHWLRLLVCLFGFVVARSAVKRITQRICTETGASHALKPG